MELILVGSGPNPSEDHESPSTILPTGQMNEQTRSASSQERTRELTFPQKVLVEARTWMAAGPGIKPRPADKASGVQYNPKGTQARTFGS